jgi:Ca2+-binding EF-hand superfamily protein
MNISGLGGGSYSYSLQTRSASSTDQTDMAQKMASRMIQEMDNDGDGALSAEEIGVDQSLLGQTDSDSDGKLSDSELISLMNTMGPPPMGAAGMSQGSAAGGAPPDSGEMFSTLDSDGDGVVSQEEFLAGRPDDVSEEQAQEMWSRLDSEGAGSLDQSQFEEAMAAMGPPPGGPGAGNAASNSANASSATASATASQSLSDMLATLLENYGKARYQQTMSSTLAGLLGGSQDTDASGISVTA